MDRATADTLAADLISLGSAYYFAPTTVTAGETFGLNPAEFYGIGRGGVLGPVDAAEVEAAFYFFPRRTVDLAWSKASDVDVVAVAEAHERCADVYGETVFSGVGTGLLKGASDAGDAVAAVVEVGRCPIYDRYRRLPRPTTLAARAYRAVVDLRELRGGLHRAAVAASGLAGNEATYLHDQYLSCLHGYDDSDISDPVTEGMRHRHAQAEVETSATTEAYLDRLPDASTDAPARGPAAMRDARDAAPAPE